MTTAVMGIVETRMQADDVIANLQRAGILTTDISVLFPDKDGSHDFAHENNTKAPEGAVAGASTGGVVGGTIGLLAGVGALAIPGLGPFIAAGPLMAALSGAAAGAAVGGVSGGLIGMGFPEIEAKRYEGKVQGGNILIAVHTETSEAKKAAEVALKTGGAHDVVSTSEASVPKGKEQRVASR